MSTSQVEPCLLMNRRIEQRQEHSITHTEITERRIIQEGVVEMQHYKNISQDIPTSANSYHSHTNGGNAAASAHSPHSSMLSLHSDDQSGVGTGPRHKNAVATSVAAAHHGTNTQVTSKVMHEVTHQHQVVGADAQSIDYVAMPLGVYAGAHQCGQYIDYNHLDGQMPMYSQAEPQYHLHSHYQNYEHYPETYGTSAQPGAYLGGYISERAQSPRSTSEHSGPPSPNLQHGAGEYLPACYDELTDQYRVTPSPGILAATERYPSADEQAIVYGYTQPSIYGMRSAGPTYDTGGPPGVKQFEGVNGRVDGSVYDDDELQKHVSSMSIHGHTFSDTLTRTRGPSAIHPIISGAGSMLGSMDDEQGSAAGMRWRDPNLTEVIGFLNNPNNVIKANAAAYLQHLCYMDDPNKQKTRALGGIPPLVKLLLSDSGDVFRNACGALRNLSYGRQNDENKRAIKNAGGIPALITLLNKTTEAEVKELITGVVWNMSSCEDLKRAIIDDGVCVIVSNIIIPHSGWDVTCPGETCWSTVFRNASGVLRNVSSAGEHARKKLRECDGLIDSLLYVVKSAIDKSNIGNKIVENCVCVLRNLSYRCQEIEDPNYDKNPLPTQSRVSEYPSKSENLGCFGASKKKKDANAAGAEKPSTSGGGGGATAGQAVTANHHNSRDGIAKGTELLWQPEVVQLYLALLQSCSNPETLEAAAGALQNLSACYWQPSIEIRAAVRKEKGLPILVELLRMEVDRVVCAVATALRNLAIDQRNKELIGKYAMRDLVQKLPSGNMQHDQGTSDDTIAAVLATLNEVIKKNAEFSRSLLESGGVDRLMNITRQRQKYTPRVLKFAGQLLFTMWQHVELRDVYKKHGWKETDFITKTVAARNAQATGPNSPNNANNTLNRPMASQGGTRYEDRTIKRGNSGAVANNMPAGGGDPIYRRNDDIPLADMAYPENPLHVAVGQPHPGVRMYSTAPTAQPPTTKLEPLYAQVDLEKKRNRHSNVDGAWSEAVIMPPAASQNDPRNNSWV